MLKRLYILLFVAATCGVDAQSQQKEQTAVFEYSAAEYRSTEKMNVIEVKGIKNEIYFFHLYEKDKVKNSELLFNPLPDNNTTSKKISTNVQLVGKKVQLKFIPINEIDPANPYCCYRIIEVTPL